MKYFVTYTLNNEERKLYEEKGLYCYDLRDSDFGNDIASIEKKVIINNIGSIITNKEIKLGTTMKDNYVDYNTFVSHNKSVNKIEELLSKNQKERSR